MIFLKRGDILLFFQEPFFAHFFITSLKAIQVLVWYKNLSYFFAEYHRLETPLYDPVTQWITRPLVEQKITGSNPGKVGFFLIESSISFKSTQVLI